jgi:hypothetical protein
MAKEPEILSLLEDDHDNVKDLFVQFEEELETGGKEAIQISHKILDELTIHAELEEQIIYPLLKDIDESLFYEAQEEHHVAKFLIGELKEMNGQEPSFEAKMMVLRETVEMHIEEEENEIFDELGDLPEAKLDQAAEMWKSQKASMMRGREVA